MFPHFTDKSPAIDVSVALVTTHWKFPHDFASGTDVDTQLPRFTVEEPEPPPFDPEPDPDPDPDPVPVGEINPVLDSKLQPANSRAATARTLNPARVLFITTSSLQTRLHAYNFVIATPEDFVKIEDNPFNVDLPAEVSPGRRAKTSTLEPTLARVAESAELSSEERWTRLRFARLRLPVGKPADERFQPEHGESGVNRLR